MNLKKIIKSIRSNSTFTNVIIVGVATLIVSGLGFVKEMIIADNFGLSELLDTFLIAILIPSFISGVFLSSFQSVFIPNFVSELKTGKNIGSFQSTSFLVTLGISIFFCLIAYLATDVYLEIFFKGHTQHYYSLVKKQFYFVLPCIFFWGFSSLLRGLLNIDNEFTLSSSSAVFIPLSIIICLIFFKEDLGNIVLALGTLVGSFLSFLSLLIVALKRNIIRLNVPDFLSKNIKILFTQLPAKVASSLLTGVNKIVDQYFAAQLIIGSISALNYGIKIPMFSMGIATIAIGNVLLPYFSKKAVENREDSFNEFYKILKIIIYGSSAIAVILILISTPIISIIFERNAFTSEDTVIVSKIQQMYLLMIPAYIGGQLMVKFLTSINKNNFMALVSAFSLILNIILNYILIKTMGVYGLALSTSLVSIITGIILYIYIKHLNKSNV